MRSLGSDGSTVMVEEIQVTPAEGGWTVSHGGALEPLVFRSGARAEDAARRLAEAMAEVGQAAEIKIILRDGSLAGHFISTPGAQA